MCRQTRWFRVTSVLTALIDAGVPKTELFAIIMVLLLVLAFGAAAWIGWRAEHPAASRRSSRSPVTPPREARFYSLVSHSV